MCNYAGILYSVLMICDGQQGLQAVSQFCHLSMKKNLGCSIPQTHYFRMSIACIVNPEAAHTSLSFLVEHLLKMIES